MASNSPTPLPSADRGHTADSRDRTADLRDRTATRRDEFATERDDRAAARDTRDGRIDLDAAADRSEAKRDRRAALCDRGNAGDDRYAAATERSLAAFERDVLLVDELTGAYRRGAGLMELEREIIKSEREGHAFVLAFIDVDGLKAVNDNNGHGAGDHLLCDVADCVRGVLRDYDVIVRYGGDEFLCGLPNMVTAEVVDRLDRANTELEQRDHASVTVGLAERQSGEGLRELIDRADAAMYAVRQTRIDLRDSPG